MNVQFKLNFILKCLELTSVSNRFYIIKQNLIDLPECNILQLLVDFLEVVEFYCI